MAARIEKGTIDSVKPDTVKKATPVFDGIKAPMVFAGTREVIGNRKYDPGAESFGKSFEMAAASAGAFSLNKGGGQFVFPTWGALAYFGLQSFVTGRALRLASDKNSSRGFRILVGATGFLAWTSALVAAPTVSGVLTGLAATAFGITLAPAVALALTLAAGVGIVAVGMTMPSIIGSLYNRDRSK